MTILKSCSAIVCGLVVCNATIAGEFRFFHENVLGTSLELQLQAESSVAAEAAEELVLSEIDRLNKIFSSYDSSSELTKFLALPAGESMRLSDELFASLKACEQWATVSRGAFNPAVEQLSQTWHAAERTNRTPDEATLLQVTSRIGDSAWQLDPTTQHAKRTNSVPLSLNAIAKGIILDRAVEKVLDSARGIGGVMLNIGGDVRVAGMMTANISIAHPGHDSLTQAGLTDLQIENAAVATSGGSERRFHIGEHDYSHILDPRSGKPAGEILSSTVLADEASKADALATICSVLTVAESLQLVDSLPNVACMLVTASGAIVTSPNWPQDAQPKRGETVTEGESSPHEVLIQFEISKAENSGRYRRPYVAVWIEDKNGFPVKTLSLFLMKDQPGPRWHRDLRRWYTDDQMRLLVDETSMIETVSKPTRNPGQYKVSWDGRDDADKLLPNGAYTLLIEAAREHGTYQLMKHPFQLGGKSLDKKLKGNVEIATASITYKSKAVDK